VHLFVECCVSMQIIIIITHILVLRLFNRLIFLEPVKVRPIPKSKPLSIDVAELFTGWMSFSHPTNSVRMMANNKNNKIIVDDIHRKDEDDDGRFVEESSMINVEIM